MNFNELYKKLNIYYKIKFFIFLPSLLLSSLNLLIFALCSGLSNHFISLSQYVGSSFLAFLISIVSTIISIHFMYKYENIICNYDIKDFLNIIINKESIQYNNIFYCEFIYLFIMKLNYNDIGYNKSWVLALKRNLNQKCGYYLAKSYVYNEKEKFIEFCKFMLDEYDNYPLVICRKKINMILHREYETSASFDDTTNKNLILIVYNIFNIMYFVFITIIGINVKCFGISIAVLNLFYDIYCY